LKFATFLVSKFSSSGADDCAAPQANCWTRLGDIASLVNLQLQYAMQQCATSGQGGCTDFTRVDGEFNAALPGLAASSVEMVWPEYTIYKRTPVDYHLRVANLVDNTPPIGLWPHTLNQFGEKGITHLSTWYTPNSSVALARNGSADYKFSLLNLFAAYE
jgi:hypothetical protein